MITPNDVLPILGNGFPLQRQPCASQPFLILLFSSAPRLDPPDTSEPSASWGGLSMTLSPVFRSQLSDIQVRSMRETGDDIAG
jgi:hypothetical protein